MYVVLSLLIVLILDRVPSMLNGVAVVLSFELVVAAATCSAGNDNAIGAAKRVATSVAASRFLFTLFMFNLQHPFLVLVNPIWIYKPLDTLYKR
ncbi:hypothetical protein D3C76_1008820 [compost metagenome]